MYIISRFTFRIMFFVIVIFTATKVMFSNAFDANSSDISHLNGYVFTKTNGNWYVKEPSKTFKVSNKFITVNFKHNLSKEDINTINKIIGTKIYKNIWKNIYSLELLPGKDPIKSVKKYLESNLVEYADVNTGAFLLSDPNDTYYYIQTYLNHGSDYDLDAPMAWDIEKGDEDVVIAIIDTGVDINHPDLNDNKWTNTAEINGVDGVDDDDNGYIDDFYGYQFLLS